MNIQNIQADSRFKALESFKSAQTAATMPEVAKAEIPKDEVQIQQKPKKKTSLLQKFKNVCAACKKFGIVAKEYAVGAVKGIANGMVAAAGILGIDAAIGIAKRIKASTPAEKAANILSTKGKVLAGIAGVATLGYNLFQANLNVAEKKANIDHRWSTGHTQNN